MTAGAHRKQRMTKTFNGFSATSGDGKLNVSKRKVTLHAVIEHKKNSKLILHFYIYNKLTLI